ncbi:sensor histidine kinase [Sinomonas cyclohexanicum]|nr:histidine kinase [Corynebacterium cyclohexanicum]
MTPHDDGRARADFGDEQRAARSFRLLGLVFASIWLVWLLQPLVAAMERIGTVRGAVGLVSVVAFAVVYVWQFSRRGSFMGPERPGTAAQAWGGYAAMAVLSMVCVTALGQTGSTPFVFLAIAGMWTMPLAWAMAVGAVLAGAYVLAWNIVPGWYQDVGTLVGMGMGIVAVGLSRIAVLRQRDLGQARRENARLMVEEERTRFARDLHDILGHSLTVITVKAELARRVVDTDPERAKAELDDLERLSRDALADVRRAVDGYREISLPGELARARAALAATGIEAEIPRATDAVPTPARELFAWAIREGITNVLRHSGATRCEILLGTTSVTIADDGGGRAPSSASASRSGEPGGAAGPGHGLVGLQERARALGATVETGPGPLDGFALTVRLGAGPAAGKTGKTGTTA